MTDHHELAKHADKLPSAPDMLHPAVARMLDLDPTPEALREILALQREYEADVARKAYHAGLVALKAELPAFLDRDATVDYTHSKGRTFFKHTSLAAAMDAVAPILGKHGFALTWEPATPEPGLVKVSARLSHRAGHTESCSMSAPPDPKGGKTPPQAVASTQTLLQRYTALALLGIATGDMKEPEPVDDDPERIDTAANLRAVAYIRENGLNLHDAEEHVGRPHKEWRSQDLAALRAWVQTPNREEEA